mmetsp:Transcript_13970/g.48231  ORF Transcript_13970/g.48231 Transcript_13970/m.48231 type:complete len:346 (+) Transcript_13970:701-1738(+)
MLLQILVEEQVVMTQVGEALRDPKVEDEARRRHDEPTPLLLRQVSIPGVKEVLLHVMVVPSSDDEVRLEEAGSSLHSRRSLPLHTDLLCLVLVAALDLHMELLSQSLHGLRDLIQPALGVPRAQLDRCVVHHGVHGWDVLGGPAEEKDRPFHDGDEVRVLEVRPHMRCLRLEHLQPERLSEHPYVEELPQVEARAADVVTHGHSILVLGLLHEGSELRPCPCLFLLEHVLKIASPVRDVQRPAVAHEQPVRRVEPLQLEVLGGLPTKVGEPIVEHIWHPVPARAHVKGVSSLLPRSTPTTHIRQPLQNSDIKAVLCQTASGRQTSESSTYNHHLLRGPNRNGHEL